MYRFSVPLLVFAMSLACGSGDKGGDTDTTAVDADADTDADSDTDTPSSTDDAVDSCDWSDFNMCFEFTDFAGTSDLCDEIESNYGSPVTYAEGPCAGGAIYQCDVPGVGTGVAANEPAVISYYQGFDDPAGACASAGGTPH